ncbi:MAG: hypothetical protein COU69_00990 [Candidatus Pacebacteria bacterium CG10_big_fil_rev_8_21_14_0_10_56_10]|nr:MAG: hypothetical protein COU69_00990 [Candidatus Pacebacteria bacterium CG10_big_fil_rev_8_21_14_0_10_56_10]
MNIELTDIHLRYILNTRRFMVWTAGLAALTVGLLVVGVVPQALAAVETYQQLKQEQAKLDQLERKVVQLDQVTEEVLISQSQVIDKVLPSSKPLLEALAALSAVADNSGVRFEQVQLSPGAIATTSAQRFSATQPPPSVGLGPSDSRFDSLELDVTVSGDIGSVTTFLRQVERIAPLTTIQKMTLKPQADNRSGSDGSSSRGPGPSFFQVDLRLSSMFFTQLVTTQVDTPLPDFGGRQQEILTEVRGYTFPTLEQQREIIGGGSEDLFSGQTSLLESVGLVGSGEEGAGPSELESLEGLSPELPSSPLPDTTQPAESAPEDSLPDLDSDLESLLEFELP